jgi:membrane associated rhomboid family serine protease
VIPAKDNVPTARFPLITVALILANLILYLVAIVGGGSIISGPDPHEVAKYGATPYALSHHPGQHWATAFSAMFVHASIVQLAGNLLFLWIFGNTLEAALGRLKYLGFYLLAGLVALALQVAIAPNATGPTLSASGAVAGVLGGYILLYPRARVLALVLVICFVTVLEIPALVMLVVWFAEQAAFAATNLVTPTGSGGVAAYFAWVGGFLFGLATIRLLIARRQPLPPAAVVH